MVKILLIEDHTLNRDTLVCRLTRHELQGIELAKKESPAIIQMNMSLPELDHPRHRLTAHAMPGDREQALEPGCSEYEAKPVDFCAQPQKIH